jgi:hypothetical protein
MDEPDRAEGIIAGEQGKPILPRLIGFGGGVITTAEERL